MVINCLPLYDPPPRTSAASENDATSPPPATTSSPASTSSSQARKRESKLKKARSEEILNKSNAPKPEKEDGGSKSDGEDVEEVWYEVVCDMRGCIHGCVWEGDVCNSHLPHTHTHTMCLPKTSTT